MAISLARNAGKAIMRTYGQSIEFTMKSPDQELTAADEEANSIITKGLQSTNHSIISEENDKRAITEEPVWVVDPLDGTKGFIKHTGDFCVMIGMLKKRKPVLGVVYVPVTGTLYYAKKGAGAWIEDENGKRQLQTSGEDALSRFRIVISKEHFKENDAAFAKKLGGEFVKRGSIGIKLGEIAAGNADLYYNFDGLSIWDICAPQAILEEAGGEVYDLQGNPLLYTCERFTAGIIATNGHCKEELLLAMREFRL